MKILITEADEVEVWRSNHLAYSSDECEDVEEEDDEEEEDTEEEEESGDEEVQMVPFIYELTLYKNVNASTIDPRKVQVAGVDFKIIPLSETNAALVVQNVAGQNVFSIAWELVYNISARPISPK